MGVYINKAELLKELSVIQDRPVSTAMKIIKELSTIDLVRCGECKWFLKGEGEYGKCTYRTRPMLYCLPTDFCSYGERANNTRTEQL